MESLFNCLLDAQISYLLKIDIRYLLLWLVTFIHLQHFAPIPHLTNKNAALVKHIDKHKKCQSIEQLRHLRIPGLMFKSFFHYSPWETLCSTCWSLDTSPSIYIIWFQRWRILTRTGDETTSLNLLQKSETMEKIRTFWMKNCKIKIQWIEYVSLCLFWIK